MIVVVTMIELKGPLKFFVLANISRKILQQVKRAPGMKVFKTRGFWTTHYTLTAWSDMESMKAFAKSGHHLEGMKQSAKLAKVLSTYTYEADAVPNWKTAIPLLKEKGRHLHF